MTREMDDRLLRALYICALGGTIREAAQSVGVPKSTLARDIARVRTEDSLCDPEAAAYWQRIIPPPPRRKDTA